MFNEGKKNHFDLKTIIIIVLIFVIIGESLLLIFYLRKNSDEVWLDLELENVSKESYLMNDYYIIKDDYSGEYDLQYIYLSDYFDEDKDILTNMFSRKTIMDYDEYISYCDDWKLEKKYDDKFMNYIVYSTFTYGSPNIIARLAEIEYVDKDVNLYVWDESSGVTADVSAYVIVIPTNKDVNDVNVQMLYSECEYDNIKEFGVPYNPNDETDDKPIIYLYPNEEMEVTVKLGFPENILVSYPKYEISGWNVLASPNGNLIDLSTQRNLYSLYYESNNVVDFEVENTGFVIKGEDTIEFLEEKLEILGLTERETEEFIIYWLPKLEVNNYNYIRFATMDEINNNMSLDIKPNPDTLIRILMVYKGLDQFIEVKEQELISPVRKGFVVVEWGGVEIK